MGKTEWGCDLLADKEERIRNSLKNGQIKGDKGGKNGALML
jgi:hypothetical protein